MRGSGRARQGQGSRHGAPMLRILTTSVVLLACGVANGSGNRPTSIVLDFVPFMDPVATTVQIDAEGRASAFRYAPGALRVQSWQEAPRVGRSDQGAIEKATGDVMNSGLCRPSASDGLRRGDQFALALVPKSGAATQCAGFVADAAPTLRVLVELLRGLADRLPARALPSDFARARPLERARQEKLRAAGAAFLSLDAPASEPTGISRRAIAAAPAFVPVSPSDAERLRSHASASGQLYVDDGDRAWEIQLFRGPTVP